MNHAGVDVLLTDGTIVVLRRLEPADRPAVAVLHDGASDTSFRMRFFGTGRTIGHHYVEHLFSEAPAEITLVALVGDRIVAVASAERLDATTAEVAFLVADDQRGHGVGILLLEHLAAAGRGRGITRFTAEVLSENVAMLRLFRAAGFLESRVASHGVIDIEMSTAASAVALEAADARESTSQAHSLSPLTHPGSVAVIGVRRDGTGVGAAVLASIIEGGFTGEVVVVHPTASEVAGVTAYPRLLHAPGRVDLVVVAVPARRVRAALDDAVAAGAGVVVVVSSGFAELGAEGVALQRELVRLARTHGVRLVGPNCLGVQVNDPAVRLNATFTRLVPRSGGLAVASQSGGVGVALLDVALRTGLGVRIFVSLGNKADVSGNDLLSAWLDDPEVSAAALYLESLGNAPKFARVARRFSERKPLLVVLGGRSVGGQRGGASHTAAAATSTVAVEALFGHSGVIACRNAEEIVETARVLAEQPLARGRRTAILTNAGGMGILVADAADAAGLVVASLSLGLEERLTRVAPDLAGASNPVDVGAGATSGMLAAVTAELLASGEVDALLVVLVATRVADAGPLEVAVGDARSGRPDLPVLLVTIGVPGREPKPVPGVTALSSVGAAVEVLARVSRYAAWLAVPRCDPPAIDTARATAARSVALEHLDRSWLTATQSTALLAPYGLAPEGVTVAGADAAEAAARLGFPVAVKVADPRVVHKTERGLVRAGLTTPAQVTETVAGFALELGAAEVDVLVQPMRAGVEMALGLVRDPTFGPLVMVAAGGTATDVWADRVFLLPPLDAGSVARAVRSLRCWPLLDGHRGAAPVDVAVLERQVLALGDLATDVPEVAELDLNPVLVDVDGTHLVDVKVRLAPASPLDAGVPRRLRDLP